jgi:hypothetical protein
MRYIRNSKVFGNHRRLAIKTAIKIEIQPIRGICPACNLRSLGLSTKQTSIVTGLKNLIAINAKHNSK